MKTLAVLQKAVGAVGMRLRGAFYDHNKDETIVLVGALGEEIWPAFAATKANWAAENPLDHWTRQVLTPIADAANYQVVFPCDGPPYPPFYDWAQRADKVFPSPTGILIHPEFGLWHSYRGAFIISGQPENPLPPIKQAASPCESCVDKPCLTVCPVHAFDGKRYDAVACQDFLRTQPNCICLRHSCQARLVCPVGRDYTYPMEYARFLMQQFIK